MLGFGKGFVIFIFIAVLIGFGTKSWQNTAALIGGFIGVKIIWKLLT